MSHTILVVEDDSTQRTLLGVYLKRAGYSVIEARDGAEAIDVIKDVNQSLIIMDIVLPVMNGIEATKELRKLSDATIIFLTINYNQANIIDSLSAGGVDVLSKPILHKELIARVSAHLRERDRTPVAKLENSNTIGAFISYARSDWSPWVEAVVSKLEFARIPYFIDRIDVARGKDWYDAVNAGLEKCAVMILVITPDAMNSANVKMEYRSYINKKPVFPLICRPAALPFELQNINYYEFGELNVLIGDLKKRLDR